MDIKKSFKELKFNEKLFKNLFKIAIEHNTKCC